MASTVPKIGPTLRGGVGGTADALAGSPVGARRTKKIVTKDVIKVSNNFGATLQRRYPSRLGSGSGTLDGSLAASQSVVIPSDEELSEAEDSTRAAKRAPGADEADAETDFAAAATSNGSGDEEYEGGNEKAGDRSNAITYDATRHDAPTGGTYAAKGRPTASQVVRKHLPSEKEARSAQGVNQVASVHQSPTKAIDTANRLRFGMEALRDNMTVPGTTAHRFAATMGSFDEDDAWADDFGAFVAATRDESTALDLALSPAYKAQTYLCIDRNANSFVVLHGLRRWTPSPSSRSINSGRLVAWEGETIEDGGPPDLWRLDDEDDQLFRLCPFSGVDLRAMSNFYSTEHNDKTFFGVGDHSQRDDHWVSRLIPIPIGWAAFFVDYPPLGVAFRRVMDLINSVATDKADNFRILAGQVACVCFHTGSIERNSSMSLHWSRLARSKANIQRSQLAWQAVDDELDLGPLEGSGARKEPPEQTDDFRVLFGGGKRHKLDLGQWAPPIRADRRGQSSPDYGAYDRAREPNSPPGRLHHGFQLQPGQHADAHASDLAGMLAAMVQAQTEGQIAVAAANNANLIAFTTATAQALATSAGGEKASKLTPARKTVLRACSGEGDSAAFAPPPVFSAMSTNGGTVDAIGLTLRRLLQPDGLNARHRTQLYVTPQLVQTVKTFNFSASGDKSFAGCSKGITVFAVPWRSHESMTEEALEEDCYQQSTHKTTADVRKHTAGTRVEIPSDLLGLSRLCNNYCKLLEVLFGHHCPHLVQVAALRAGLELHEHDLELKITKSLCLHLLWRIHFDARQFFTACERWTPESPVPRSALGNTVARLVDDCEIAACLTCPVAAFMGLTPAAKTAGTAPATRAGQANKPTTNASIPPMCKPTVDLFNAQHPTMSFLTLIKKGGLQYSDLRVGGKGDCSSFGLLGRCAGCTYNHVACTVSAERQAAITVSLKAAMVALNKKPRPTAPSTPRTATA